MHDLAMHVESVCRELEAAKRIIDTQGNEILTLRDYLQEIVDDAEGSASDIAKTIRGAAQYLAETREPNE